MEERIYILWLCTGQFFPFKVARDHYLVLLSDVAILVSRKYHNYVHSYVHGIISCYSKSRTCVNTLNFSFECL